MNEASLEDLLVEHLLEVHDFAVGHSAGFAREYGIDRAFLLAFLESTQNAELIKWKTEGGVKWHDKLLQQLHDTIHKRGVVAVWRDGLKCGTCRFVLYYARPSSVSTEERVARWKSNRFSVSRQLHFSSIAASDSIDVALFLNGLPFATIELKNAWTHQTVANAMRQYKDDRDPKEPLFKFAHCLVHFAVDADEVWMTTHLRGQNTGFLPFNKGTKNGGGNPINPHGPKTAYLWEDVFAPHSIGEIVERFAQLVEETGDDGAKRHKLIFPRFHQRDCVHRALDDVRKHGAGQKYLIQHSAGSGKSNTIAWLCHQLVTEQREDEAVFDSVVLVTDRRVLDRQIAQTVKQFAHAPGLIEHAGKGSWQLRAALQSGKKIIITTIQKFPFVLDEIGELPQSRFAVVIDEAHSSQGGRVAGEMNAALSGGSALSGGKDGDDAEYEDQLNALIASRKMLTNASYFAFTATPKNRTLENFGVPQGDGTFKPFHEYSMKQAIAEGFILDVLRNYTTYQTFYTLLKTDDSDPEFDVSRAQKKLRAMVERNPDAIEKKAAIMIEHFRSEVANRMKKSAKAMIVTSGIENAIRYRQAFDRILQKENLPFQALVAFSGEKMVDGLPFTEDGMNGFESGKIPEKFKATENKFLIVADKFQTGFDEPLLHTMYVDKPLAGVQAVQTLSRLNRAYPLKNETFVLDFANKAQTIKDAFEPFYEGTILSEETDINRLNLLQDDIESVQVFSPDERTQWVQLFLGEAERAVLEPLIDGWVERFRELSPDEQIKFKGDYKSFTRAYEFLSAIRPFVRRDWEELAVVGRYLVPKLPAPQDDDGSKGVLEATALHSYRVVRRDVQLRIELEGASEIEPASIPSGGLRPEPQLDRLSAIIKAFNERYGQNLSESQEDFLAAHIPQTIAGDEEYQAAKEHSDLQNAQQVFEKKFDGELQKRMFEETELFKKLSQDKDLKSFLVGLLFDNDYNPSAPEPQA